MGQCGQAARPLARAKGRRLDLYDAGSVRRYGSPNLTLAPFAVINFERATVASVASVNNTGVFLVGGFLGFGVGHFVYSFVVCFDGSNIRQLRRFVNRYEQKKRPEGRFVGCWAYTLPR